VDNAQLVAAAAGEGVVLLLDLSLEADLSLDPVFSLEPVLEP